MKIKNTTEHPVWFLRRMVAWCAKEIGFPVSEIRLAEFGKRSRGEFNGRAWYRSRRIRVVIGPASEFPVAPYLYPGRKSDAFMSPEFRDQLEALVGVTAHEIAHLFQYHGRSGNAARRGERVTQHWERKLTELFRDNREALIAEWSIEPTLRAAKPKQSAQDRRAEKAANMLAAWQRKAKLAATKIKKYKRQVAYYDRATAANRKDKTDAKK